MIFMYASYNAKQYFLPVLCEQKMSSHL